MEVHFGWVDIFYGWVGVGVIHFGWVRIGEHFLWVGRGGWRYIFFGHFYG